jgi:hypothetical protein
LGRRRKRARDDGSALSPEAHPPSRRCDGGSRDAAAEMGWSPSRGAQVIDLTMDDSARDEDGPPAEASQPATPSKLPYCARIYDATPRIPITAACQHLPSPPSSRTVPLFPPRSLP